MAPRKPHHPSDSTDLRDLRDLLRLLGGAVEVFTSHLKPTAEEIKGAGWFDAVDSTQSRGLPGKARAGLARHQSIRNLMIASTTHASVTKNLSENCLLPSALDTLRGMACVIKAAVGCVGLEWAIREDKAAVLSEKNRDAADALHNKPGGSRAKTLAIRELWKSGKYSNRDLCAEQECAALGMSFSSARKALIKTPKPA